jgi:hypothetical protein
MNGVPPSIEISGECNRRSVTHNLPGTTTTTMVIEISLIGSGLRSTELFPRVEFRTRTETTPEPGEYESLVLIRAAQARLTGYSDV